MKKLNLAILLLGLLLRTALAQTPEQYKEFAENDAKTRLNVKKNGLRNLYMKENVIHILVSEDGNLLLKGYPTTATDKNRFQFHLYVSKGNTSSRYRFGADGNYEPTLNIDSKNDGKKVGAAINYIDFPEVGPFTGTVSFSIKKVDGATTETLTSANVKIAKTIHASIGTGFVFSTLKDPSNFKKVPLNGSGLDSTLMADNTNGNTSLVVMATLYPWGRNSLMLGGESWKDIFGLVFGTRIASNAKNFQNLYAGVQVDFAVGGSFVFGLDIANRQKLRGLDNFKYGETVFTGKQEDRLYKKVGTGFFVGVQVDSRIFAKMFTP